MGRRKLERRDAPRAAVMLAATISHDWRSKAVTLRNLSGSGALVEGEALPIKGSLVSFVRNDVSVRGHVVWVEGERGGIRFEQPLNLRASLRHVPSPRRKWEPRPRRPGLKCVPLSEGEKRNWERWTALGLTALGD